MDGSASSFRLREPRSPLAFPVLVEWYDEVKRHIARNICDSGIYIDAEPPYPIGAVVRVVFIYPGTQVELVAIGEVRHRGTRPRMVLGERVDVAGVGIEFIRFEDGVVKPVSAQIAS